MPPLTAWVTLITSLVGVAGRVVELVLEAFTV